MVENNINRYHKVFINSYKVFEILDFITEEEQNFIWDVIQNATEDDWPLEVDNQFLKNDPSLSGRTFYIKDEHRKITTAIDQRIEDLFENNGWINQIATIQRFFPDTGMGLHVDNEVDDSVLFGVVIYLNDDYEGGEIHYPDLDLTIKPKAKSVVIHPANIKHEVLPVKGNQKRYTFSLFVRGDKTTKFIYSHEMMERKKDESK